MGRSYNVLPEGYEVVEEIDLKNNKKQFWFINIGTFVLAILLIIPMFFFEYSISFGGDFKFSLMLLAGIAASIVAIILHELVHGLFFKIFGKGKLKFGFHGFAVSCCMKDVYFSKPAYFLIIIAPFVLISAALAALSAVFYNTDIFLIFYVSLIMNFSGSIGDLFVAYRLLRRPKTVLALDNGVGMKFYDLKQREEGAV